MNAILPPLSPQQKRERTVAILCAAGIREKVQLLGVRGYYRDTMGQKGKNDRGIYDDAIFLSTPECHVAYMANTDPSIFRKGIAVLKTGTWEYKTGTHGLSKPKNKQYTALVQAAPVTVLRDNPNGEPIEDTGFFGINIHRGGENTTSSLGCQTIVPDMWPSFIELVQQQLKKYGQETIPYVLTENLNS